MTAIIGTANAGVGVIAQLAVGLSTAETGAVRIGGLSVADLDDVVRTQYCGFVDSTPILFAGSISDNISLYSPWMDHQDVVAASKFVGMHEEIMSRAGAYQTMVLEGGRNFSGGQKQRLELARAVAKDCPLYVLDEPTAALDYESESFIIDQLRTLEATKLIVTNRTTVTRKADHVLVLSNGRLVEQGTHDELVAKGGLYAIMVGNQES